MIATSLQSTIASVPGPLSGVTVIPGGVTVMARPGEVILDAIRRYGHIYRFGCRRGGCGRCKVRLLNGCIEETTAIAETVLSGADRSSGLILSCRSVPLSEISIELVDGDRLRRTVPFLASIMAEEDSRVEAHATDRTSIDSTSIETTSTRTEEA